MMQKREFCDILCHKLTNIIFYLIILNGEYMLDVKEYEAIAKKLSALTPDDTLQIILETKDPDVRQIYSIVGDYFLQKKQKEVIAKEKY